MYDTSLITISAYQPYDGVDMEKELPMNRQDMVSIFKRIIDESFNNQIFDVLREYFSPDYIEHQFGLKQTLEGMQDDIKGLHRSFQDFKLTIEDITVDEDMLWARMTARGTNTGGFMGPPNGKTFEASVIDIIRFKDGKIVDHWGVPDRFAIISQLGLMPSRG